MGYYKVKKFSVEYTGDKDYTWTLAEPSETVLRSVANCSSDKNGYFDSDKPIKDRDEMLTYLHRHFSHIILLAAATRTHLGELAKDACDCQHALRFKYNRDEHVKALAEESGIDEKQLIEYLIENDPHYRKLLQAVCDEVYSRNTIVLRHARKIHAAEAVAAEAAADNTAA